MVKCNNEIIEKYEDMSGYSDYGYSWTHVKDDNMFCPTYDSDNVANCTFAEPMDESSNKKDTRLSIIYETRNGGAIPPHPFLRNVLEEDKYGTKD